MLRFSFLTSGHHQERPSRDFLPLGQTCGSLQINTPPTFTRHPMSLVMSAFVPASRQTARPTTISDNKSCDVVVTRSDNLLVWCFAVSLGRRWELLLMGYARCNCGAVTLSPPEEPSKIVVACHCIDCQRRTGAPFGVGTYYPAEVVTISGASKEFTHAAASGGEMHNYFCPQCGSTVYWTVTNLPSMIGVAVGAMANPKYPAPVISVFEQSKHDWVQIDGAVEHFRGNYQPKNSN